MQEIFDQQLEIQIENMQNHFPNSDQFIQNQNQNIHQLNNPLNQQESHLENEYIDVDRILNFEEIKVFIDELICPICTHILIDPRICLDCNQGFCKQCLSSWFDQYHTKSCPCCRSISNQSNDGSQAPKLLFKLLSKLKISCKYYNNGCKEIIWYDNKQKHYDNQCQYRLIICQYCHCKIIKIDSETHFQQCQYKPIQCIQCQQTFSYYDYQKHYDNCSKTFKCTQSLLEQQFSKNTLNYCQKKKYKNQYLQNKSEIQKTKQELLEQMQKIKKLERFIKNQKLQNQEKQLLYDNESINSFEDKNQLDYQQQFNQKIIDIQEQFQDHHQEKSFYSENYLEYPIQEINISDIVEIQQIKNYLQEEVSDI